MVNGPPGAPQEPCVDAASSCVFRSVAPPRAAPGRRRAASRAQRADARRYAGKQYLIGGNWKCNGTKESVNALIKTLNEAGPIPAWVLSLIHI